MSRIEFEMNGTQDRAYLHDGVYVGHDGWQIWVAAERDGRVHQVALDAQALQQLDRYRELLAQRSEQKAVL
jgi:glycine cleavage system aminomethyltransferase T